MSTLSRRALVTGLVGACGAPRLAQAEGFRPFEAIAVQGAPALDRPYVASLYGAAPAELRRAYADRFSSTSVPAGVRLTVRRYEPASKAGPEGISVRHADQGKEQRSSRTICHKITNVRQSCSGVQPHFCNRVVRFDDGFVDAQESELCTDREFDEIAAGEKALTEERLSARAQNQEGVPKFSDADQNGDGQISREEWAAFSGQRFAGATESSDGRMSVEEYNTWRMQGMQHIRQ